MPPNPPRNRRDEKAPSFAIPRASRGEPVYGKNPVLEALRGERRVHEIFIAATAQRDAAVREIESLARDANIPVRIGDQERIDAWAEGGVHQGVIAFAEAKTYATIEDLLARARAKNQEPFILLLDGIEDPHNLGAILRVADGAGATGVVIPGHHAAGLSPTVYKTSAGAAEHVPVARVTNLMEAIVKLKKAGVWVGGTAMDAEKVHWDEKLTGPLALIVGSEGKGMSHPVRKHCDFVTRIPMAGAVESLNVSVATAIMCFERNRQVAVKKRDG